MNTTTRTLRKGVERPDPKTRARPISPDEWVAHFVGDTINRSWVIDMRQRHSDYNDGDYDPRYVDHVGVEVDPPTKSPGEEFDYEVRTYLSRRLGEPPGKEMFAPKYAGFFEGYAEQVVDGIVAAVSEYILTGNVVPVPQEILWSIKELEVPIGDDVAETVMVVMGGRSTDWRALAKEMVKRADRKYGSPKTGRPPGSKEPGLDPFIMEQLTVWMEEVRQWEKNPNQADKRKRPRRPSAGNLADTWAERHPEMYPFGEEVTTPEIDRLRATIKKRVGVIMKTLRSPRS